MSGIFDYVPHPHAEKRKEAGPPTVAAAVAQLHGPGEAEALAHRGQGSAEGGRVEEVAREDLDGHGQARGAGDEAVADCRAGLAWGSLARAASHRRGSPQRGCSFGGAWVHSRRSRVGRPGHLRAWLPKREKAPDGAFSSRGSLAERQPYCLRLHLPAT